MACPKKSCLFPSEFPVTHASPVALRSRHAASCWIVQGSWFPSRFFIHRMGKGSGVSMDIYGYLWISMVIYHQISSYIIRYHQISSDIIRYHQISSDIIIYHHISSDIIRYHHISLDIIRYHQISSDIQKYPQRMCLGLSWAQIKDSTLGEVPDVCWCNPTSATSSSPSDMGSLILQSSSCLL